MKIVFNLDTSDLLVEKDSYKVWDESHAITVAIVKGLGEAESLVRFSKPGVRSASNSYFGKASLLVQKFFIKYAPPNDALLCYADGDCLSRGPFTL